jgi:hypothetical protein
MRLFRRRHTRTRFLPALLAIALTAAQPSSLIAQKDSLKTKAPRPDRVPAAATASTDTSAMAGPGGPRKPPPEWGSLGAVSDSTQVRAAGEIPWISRISFDDIARTNPGVWVRDQQSAGQYNSINAGGMDWRGVAVLRNGRLMNDPASGIYNPFHISMDDLAAAETITGPRAFVYGLNSNAAAVNLVPRSFFSSHPYTRIAYIQGPYEYSFSDGIYSQNILRALNLHVGFQQQTTAGRLPNSFHRAWNLRTRLTYQIADDLSLTLSEYYTGTKTHLNGGLKTPDSDASVPVASAIVNTDSYEKLTRHDVDATLAARLIGDSTDITTLTLYYSNSLREYRDEELGSSPNGLLIVQDHRSSWMGAALQQLYSGGPQQLSLGAGLEVRQIEGSPTLGRRRDVIGYVRAVEEISFFEPLTLSLFGRYDHYLASDHLGAGADTRMALGEALTVFAGVSASKRLPTYTELFWTDASVSRTDGVGSESHLVGEAGFEYRPAPGSSVRLAYGIRDVRDPILLTGAGAANLDTLAGHGALYPGFVISGGPSVTTHTLAASVAIQVWYVLVEGTAVWTLQQAAGSDLTIYPEIAARGGVFLRGKLFDDNLNLKAGIQGTYQSGASGSYFDQVTISYSENPGARATGGGSADFLLTAGIGDAIVYFTWENLLNTLWFPTPYFPVRDRGIRFGLSWEFLD